MTKTTRVKVKDKYKMAELVNSCDLTNKCAVSWAKYRLTNLNFGRIESRGGIATMTIFLKDELIPVYGTNLARCTDTVCC